MIKILSLLCLLVSFSATCAEYNVTILTRDNSLDGPMITDSDYKQLNIEIVTKMKSKFEGEFGEAESVEIAYACVEGGDNSHQDLQCIATWSAEYGNKGNIRFGVSRELEWISFW